MSIRSRISKYLQNRQIRACKRTIEYKDFSKAKSVGIIASSEHTKELSYLKERLSKSTVKEVKCIEINTLTNDIEVTKDNSYSKKDFNYWYLPSNGELKRFISSKFDLLFDLSVDNTLTEAAQKLSMAKLKIGNTENSAKEYDFIVSCNAKDKRFIDLAIHYLQEIKS
ncbi:MAG: DUF6913 domain-containing protein [Bacteroidales bacterium]